MTLADRVAAVVTAPACGEVYEVADRPADAGEWEWACAVRRLDWPHPTVLTGTSPNADQANTDAFHALRTLAGHPNAAKETP